MGRDVDSQHACRKPLAAAAAPRTLLAEVRGARVAAITRLTHALEAVAARERKRSQVLHRWKRSSEQTLADRWQQRRSRGLRVRLRRKWTPIGRSRSRLRRLRRRMLRVRIDPQDGSLVYLENVLYRRTPL